MSERAQGQERSIVPELSPDPRVIDALRGEVSEPIRTVSSKPGFEGKQVEVRVVRDGPGLFGLTDWEDNKEWSGITNHILLSARYAVYFAQKMHDAGYEANPQRILDGMIVSHPGRRQWDEAGWYPDAVEDAQTKRSISNETLGMQLIQGKVPEDAFELVVALGHNVEGFSVDPSIYDSWDYKLAIYVDHRAAQKYEPLNTRMGDFLIGNFFKRDEVIPELKERVYNAIGDLIERQKNYRLGEEVSQEVTLDEADQIAEQLGASARSERVVRRELMRLILQDADTEAALIKAGIDPDNINDDTVPMPAWEDQFRKDYVSTAENSIVQRLRSHYDGLWLKIGEEERVGIDTFTLDDILRDFPPNTWWGEYAFELFDKKTEQIRSSLMDNYRAQQP